MFWEDGVHSLQRVLMSAELTTSTGHVSSIGSRYEIPNQGAVAGVASLVIIYSDPLSYFVFLISRNLDSSELGVPC